MMTAASTFLNVLQFHVQYIYMSYQWTGHFLFISPSGHFKEGVADDCTVNIMAFELLKGDFHTHQLLFSKSMYNTSFPLKRPV